MRTISCQGNTPTNFPILPVPATPWIRTSRLIPLVDRIRQSASYVSALASPARPTQTCASNGRKLRDLGSPKKLHHPRRLSRALAAATYPCHERPYRTHSSLKTPQQSPLTISFCITLTVRTKSAGWGIRLSSSGNFWEYLSTTYRCTSTISGSIS